MEFMKRICPSCEISKQTDCEVYSTPAAEGISLERIKSYWSGFFKEKIFFSYHRCECGLLYCPIFFNEHQLSQLYASMSDNTAGVPLSPLIKTQRDYYNFLKPHININGDYLELGPDIGILIKTILEDHQFKTCWLFEPNQDVWPLLKKNMGQQPHHLLSDLQKLEAIPDKSISTMVMIHVLDHLLDPLAVLRQIKKKLAPQGVLLFVTHDEQSLLSRMTKSKWPAFCLQHPQLFNRDSIVSLLKQAGLTVSSCKKTYNYFPVMYLLKHFLWLFKLNPKLPELGWLSVKFKLGNIITIAINDSH